MAFNKNIFGMAMLSFFIYDLFQAIYDSTFHTPKGQSKQKTFSWYFKVQIIWSFLFFIFCHLIAITLVNIQVKGAAVIPYIALVALLSIRNIAVGWWSMISNSEHSGKKVSDVFMTYGISRMGVYLGTTLLFVAVFVLTGAGLSYIVALDSGKL
jgi:hypothetical protein